MLNVNSSINSEVDSSDMVTVQSSTHEVIQEVSELLDSSWLTYMQTLVDALPSCEDVSVPEPPSESHSDEVHSDDSVKDNTSLLETSSDSSLDSSIESDCIDSAQASIDQISKEVNAASIELTEPVLEVEERILNDDITVQQAEAQSTEEEAAVSQEVAAEFGLSDDTDWLQHPFSQIFTTLSPLQGEGLLYDSRCWPEEKTINCLLFKIGTATFAAPLITLGHIFEFEPELGHTIHRVPSLPNWISGRYYERRFKPLVLNGHRTLLAEDQPHLSPQFIITFGTGDWGVSCDDVSRSIVVDTEKIQWRTDTHKRPWSRGIVLQEMCTLLDIPLINRALQFDKK